MTIGERIKYVRKEKGVTQQELADALDLKQNTIATYEMDRTRPSERTLKAICSKFDVSYSWLADGIGEPFIEIERNDEILNFMSRLLKSEDSFKARLVSVLANLEEDEWVLLEKMAKKLAKEEEKKTNP